MMNEQVVGSQPSRWNVFGGLLLATVGGAALVSFGFLMPATIVMLAASLLFPRFATPVHLPRKARLIALIVTLATLSGVVGAGILGMGRVWLAASGAFLVTQLIVALAAGSSRHTG
jgi:hypothetical protein